MTSPLSINKARVGSNVAKQLIVCPISIPPLFLGWRSQTSERKAIHIRASQGGLTGSSLRAGKMRVSNANDVKIYDLSAGKSIPDWLAERKRRKLARKDSGGSSTGRHIQLLQEFEMPSVSNQVKISDDGHYVAAIGTYKPRLRCYDTDQLGIKFERCFDSEPLKFDILSQDYAKMVFLQCDRFVEIHAQFGRYYRLRIPRFGRDLSYHPQTCDTYFVGDGSDIHRLNLEQGRFLNPYVSQGSGLNVCEINPEHQLLTVGTIEGQIEAWDPRSRQRAGLLDCVQGYEAADLEPASSVPEVTALAFKDGLTMGVGLSTGHVMLYDIRSSKPLLVKDHMYGTSIKKIAFHDTHDHVLSLDAKVVKIWDRQTGQAYASIESESELNDLAIYPSSGLLFLANEQPKMQVHYLPSLGPAPRWCSFLDSLTEELEESSIAEVYDDYKFVTRQQLDDLGLEHLIGTTLLRAYMHGYFMDVRLFRKAQSLAEPYTLDRFMQDKIQKKMEEKREKRIQVNKAKLPSVNKDLFLKLKDKESAQAAGKKVSKKRAAEGNLLEDDRFKAIFEDSRFQVDPTEETYKLLNPVVSKLDDKTKARLEKQFAQVDDDPLSDDEEDNLLTRNSDIEDSSDDSSSEDDLETVQRIKDTHRSVRQEQKDDAEREKYEKYVASKVKFYELKEGEALGQKVKKRDKKSLEDRLQSEDMSEVVSQGKGHSMTFTSSKSKKQLQTEQKNKQHMKERQSVRRSVGALKNRHKKGF